MIATAAALWVAVYAAAAGTAVARHAARARRALSRSSGDCSLDGVVLVRPCAGHEPALERRLAETGGARRVVFAIDSAADAAAPSVHRARRELAAAGVEVAIVETHATGPNHKADQLARALASGVTAGARVFVFADSDVDLAGIDLRLLVEPLDGPRVGACWAPPVEAGPVLDTGDLVSHAVLDASLHAFPLLSAIDPRGLVGKLVAVRRDALEAVGGFEALRLHLGEDMELARRLRAGGWEIVASAMTAPSRAARRTLASVHGRYVRWLQVIRAQRTALLASYPLLLSPAPLFAALAAAGLALDDLVVVVAACLGLLVRLLVACAARVAAGLAPSPLTAAWQAAVADLALLGALACAISTRRVSWRAAVLTLGPDGTLEEVA